jgi:hypothetical protein
LRRQSVHRVPSRVDDVAQRPSVGQDGESIELLLPNHEAKYFCKDGWTEISSNSPPGKSLGSIDVERTYSIGVIMSASTRSDIPLMRRDVR